MLFLTERQQAREELGPDRDLLIRASLQALEYLRGLIVNLLSHERFTYTKLRLHGMRGAIETVGHRSVFDAGHIIALPLEVALCQQQLQPCLGIFALLLALRLFRVRENNQPTTQNILHIG